MSLRRFSLCLSLAAAPVAGQGDPLPALVVPPENPITVEKTLLGKTLFWEEQLSATGTISCGTCHILTAGGEDPRSSVPMALHPGMDGIPGTADDVIGSPGVFRTLANGKLDAAPGSGFQAQVTGRQAPPVINAAFALRLFWDGRAEGHFKDPLTGSPVQPSPTALEVQASGPPLSDVEMAHVNADWAGVAARIEASTPLKLAAEVKPDHAAWIAGRSYPELFEEAYGTPEVTPVRILRAIATYERTLISDQTPYDLDQLSPQAAAGLLVFRDKGCEACHEEPLLASKVFHNIGLRPSSEDLGRAGITGNPEDEGAFRTPHLRNVALRAPYFHNGSVATLEEVVDFYEGGGDFFDNLDPLMEPLEMTEQEKEDLVVFLREGLTDPRVEAGTAPFDQPVVLFSESNLGAETFGVASAGTDGMLPTLVQPGPPSLGNDTFTLGVHDVLAGAPTYLILDTAAVLDGTQLGSLFLYPAFSQAYLTFDAGLAEGAGPAGWASLVFSLPEDPVLAGVNVYGQWLVIDESAEWGVAASPGLRFQLY